MRGPGQTLVKAHPGLHPLSGSPNVRWGSLGHFVQPTSGQPVLKPSCQELLPLAETAPGLARVRPSPLTWLLVHIQQRNVIIQVGHGTLGWAAPSPLRCGKHFPGEMQGALPATLLVAAMEKGGRRDEPQVSWVSGEGGARPRLPRDPRSHTGHSLQTSRSLLLISFPCHLPHYSSRKTNADSSHYAGRGDGNTQRSSCLSDRGRRIMPLLSCGPRALTPGGGESRAGLRVEAAWQRPWLE